MKLKKGDIAVIIVCLCFFIISVIACFFLKSSGKTVKIYENNNLKYSYSIYDEREIKLSHNTVVIKNGYVFMKHSTCKNQICVKSGKKSKSRECIVCLPNKVIIEIE